MSSTLPSSSRPNWAERLGHRKDAHLVVVHADDIGMSHASNVGAFEALDAGPTSCGSVMVPCPWFAEAAAMAAQRPQVDLGVHLTLNSEWVSYRWGPVAGRSAVPSLCARDGAMYRGVAEAVEHATAQDVECELRAQVDRALAAGIDVTHLDAHMFTALTPPFIEIYGRLMRDYQLPGFITRPAVASGDAEIPPALRALHSVVDALAAEGFPIFDRFDGNSLDFADAPDEGRTHNLQRLAGLGQGLNYLIIHPSAAGDELEAMQTAKPHCRDFERRFYGSDEGRRAIAEAGLDVIGMRELRDAFRASRGAS